MDAQMEVEVEFNAFFFSVKNLRQTYVRRTLNV
jgi:hypothetical protein